MGAFGEKKMLEWLNCKNLEVWRGALQKSKYWRSN
jgi:hypothetical protein